MLRVRPDSTVQARQASPTPIRCHLRELERETGFEPATPSLEGSCSSQLSYSRASFETFASDGHSDFRFPISSRRSPGRASCGLAARPAPIFSTSAPLCRLFFFRLHSPAARIAWWRGEDSNLRRHSQQIYSLPRLTASVPLRLVAHESSKKAQEENGRAYRPLAPDGVLQCCPMHPPRSRSLRSFVDALRAQWTRAARIPPSFQCSNPHCPMPTAQCALGSTDPLRSPWFRSGWPSSPNTTVLELAMGLEPATC